MGKTVYFLGAGATKDVCENAPLNNDLLEKALRDFAGSSEAEQIENFIKELFKRRKNPPKDNQIWNLLDYVIQQGKSASPEYNLEKVSDIRDSLIKLVIKEFKKSLPNVYADSYKKFASRAGHESSAIISTNYDILIDNALAEIDSHNYGAKIRYSIPEDGPKLFNSEEEYYPNGFNRPAEQQQKNLNNGEVRLLKIHGSLNWLYCRKCKEVDLTIKKGGTEKLLTSIGVTCINKSCTNKYEPLLITPTMFKNYENRFIREIWDLAEISLIESENLIFIGYSLKDEDFQIRCLLMKALLNKARPYKNIVIVEMDPEKLKDKKKIRENKERLKTIKNKYIDLYSKRRVDFKMIGFTKYIDSL